MLKRFPITAGIFSITVALVLWQGVVPAQAQSTGDQWYKKTWHIAVYYSNTSIVGDFDGNSFLSGGNDLCVIPKINSGDGFGVGAGYRSAQAGIGIGYHETKHTSEWGDIQAGDVIPFDVVHRSYKLNLRVYPWYRSQIQPFILGEIGVERIIVKDGSVDLISAEVDDETFHGFAVGIGGGVRVYLSPILSFIGEVSKQIRGFTKIQGVVDSSPVKIERIGGDGWYLHLGVALGFGEA